MAVTNQQDKSLKTRRIKNWVLSKERISHDFIDNKSHIANIAVNIGDVFTCEIGENIGEEQCNSRPVLIVSKNFFNSNSSNVTIVPLSTSVKTRTIRRSGQLKTVLKYKTHYRLKKSDFSFLDRDSVVKCEHIRSLSKSRLVSKLGQIDETTLKRVQKRISELLDL